MSAAAGAAPQGALRCTGAGCGATLPLSSELNCWGEGVVTQARCAVVFVALALGALELISWGVEVTAVTHLFESWGKALL